MKLFYKIEFNSTNLYYKHILENLIKEYGISVSVKQYIGFILITCNDSEEKIEGFFKYLGETLPLSIFLKNSYVIKEFDESLEEIEDKNILQNVLTFTNKDIKNIINENTNIDFSNDIKRIKEGSISKIETHNGLKNIFLPSKILREEFESKNNEVKLFICNINKLSQLFSLSQKDLQLLCSIERPLVKLKFNILQNKEKEYSKSNFIYAKLPDDKETILFANALQKEGIDYLLYVKEESLQDGLKVTYFNNNNIIINGEKSLFPKYDYNLNKKYNNSKEFFNDNGGVIKATLATNNKRIKPSVSIYFSYNSDNSSISLNIPGKGLRDIIAIPNIIYDINNAMEEISLIDENTTRLITNYKNKFSQNFNREFKNKDVNGFEAILNLTSYVLGLDDYLDFENAAFNCNVKSGLQIDMKLIKIEGRNYLDYRRVIQSIMSYKMADVTNEILAYSFYESLSEFIVNQVDAFKKELSFEDIILCGNMFSNSLFLEKSHKTLSKTFNTIIPKEYSLDMEF
ncbi:hypothetical protein [Arcobacter sp.]|uniref:Kae1-like domain-containing protein n=1 Tax=Arcobacter sp. TaxID=1872629 RepID=UPI003C78F6B5